MTGTLYRQEIIEHWRFPRYRGAIQKPDLQAEVINSFCGDEIGLFLGLDPKKQSVIEARFNGEGCALMIASADILCGSIEGKSLSGVKNFTADDLLQRYGEAPSPGRLKCVLLPYQALHSCLQMVAY
jgi:nitrogen fixation NifU-like protein